IHERVQGNYVPGQLCFSGISELKSDDFFMNFTRLPRNDPTRTIDDMFCWQQPERHDMFFLLGMRAPHVDSLLFFANRVTYERSSHGSTSVTFEQDCSHPPPLPGRLVPQPKHLHKRFGGDPITIRVNGRAHHQKLFIGGTDIQPTHRPQVNAVLNLGEKPSRWVKSGILHPDDRARNKGEGPQGMSVAEIQEEANWVIERLQKKQSVLVHCTAGMNRSSTICCAVLMLLEGLSAEDALQRVREHHPWARPDSQHWLKLRWLAKTHSEGFDGIHKD
ncbi:MAG TPA: dual specificity protein phosphatase, partial [Anaerolineales bacterium]|nr:dual specificity protein phosphatase [Anaerolineales bacterium]